MAHTRLQSIEKHINPYSNTSSASKSNMTGETDYKFQGWLGHDKDSIGNLKFGEYEPKNWDETDVDIKISHCGICGSDLHTLRSGWVGPVFCD
jgi:hypothetical protein